MTQTPWLDFVQSHVRTTDPHSSHVAAEAVAPKADTQCAKVLAILERGPIATGELAIECHRCGVLNHRARVSDLRKRGYVVTVSEDGVYELD